LPGRFETLGKINNHPPIHPKHTPSSNLEISD
jgi:hypothetical protein